MRSLRWLALPLLALCGCLVEQPIEEELDGMQNRNHPPAILLRSPANSVLYLQRSCTPRFTLPQIEDRDLGDDLEIKWFVNYDDGYVTPVDHWFLDAADAEGPVRFVSNRELVLNLDGPAYDGYSTVVVEAVVSDGFADPGMSPLHRAIERGKGVATTSWTIVISEGTWCNLL